MSLNLERLLGVELGHIIKLLLSSLDTLYEKHKPACPEKCAICEMHVSLTEGIDKLVANRDAWEKAIDDARKEREAKEAAKSSWFPFGVTKKQYKFALKSAKEQIAENRRHEVKEAADAKLSNNAFKLLLFCMCIVAVMMFMWRLFS